jgi:hypothetical protein
MSSESPRGAGKRSSLDLTSVVIGPSLSSEHRVWLLFIMSHSTNSWVFTTRPEMKGNVSSSIFERYVELALDYPNLCSDIFKRSADCDLIGMAKYFRYVLSISSLSQ